MPLLSVQNVRKTYTTAEGRLDVLNDIRLTLEAGRTLALTGESGSGKSTLLHLVAGLDAPDAGAIVVDGLEIADMSEPGRAAMRRNVVGLVFQQFNLIPSLNIGDNLSFHARLAGRQDRTWLDTLTGRLGLRSLLTRYPEQLSGGQQQRVAIGRTLAAKPKLILADEPTGNLDEATGDAVLSLMLELVAQTGAGLLMATHSQRLAGMLDGRMHLHAGKIA
ncbi:ABC transporter ATP-binding protein [Pararhizobium qamdonense]|uniref:ABC transporter ATP-binding protein n=1 Tax=Pararhizobium qamdonense TaxID=3031126 RepID=UPI0023E1EF6F|nr:ABC transporter ATP-binding protein [Pararhizobium qamdonense]